MAKNTRHKTINDIIDSRSISNQGELLEILIEQGSDITQATLSRDIKELGIVKAPNDKGGYSYQLAVNPQETFNESNLFKFLSFDFSGELAIARTKPGYAMAIAGEIDKLKADSILGTVAGDDTILLIKKEKTNREDLLQALKKYLPDQL